MKKILIFVASGFSTRMGGFPKALAEVDGSPVIIHALNRAEEYYDSAYIICNEHTLPAFSGIVEKYGRNVCVRSIVTGKGDAESVWKSISLVEKETEEAFDCTFCWGDAYFATSEAFRGIMNPRIRIEEIPSILVGCSIDADPYAYFDFRTTNGDMERMEIFHSYFKKKNGPVSIGMHDQCIFRCVSSVFISRLDRYREALGFDGESYRLSPNGEMGLLDSFSFLPEIGHPASICLLPSGNVFSFNTTEELQQINELLQNKKQRNEHTAGFHHHSLLQCRCHDQADDRICTCTDVPKLGDAHR